MANPELGTKQVCPNCSAKFYDLNKRPAHCPKCHTEFDPDEAVRNRRVRARAVTPDTEADDEREDQVKEDADRDEDEEEDVATPELDEVVDEPPLSTDDDDGDAEPAPVSEDLGEFSDDEDDADDADVPFLEDEDEDDFDESEIEGLPDDGDDDR